MKKRVWRIGLLTAMQAGLSCANEGEADEKDLNPSDMSLRPLDALCWHWNPVQSPAPVPGPFKTLRAMGEGACAIRTDGTLSCWGDMVR